MAKIPARYKFLTEANSTTALLDVALKHLGLIEGADKANNPTIVNWADVVARGMSTQYTNWAADWYNKDSVPWCGLFLAYCAIESRGDAKDRNPVHNYLSALAWAAFGVPVQWRGREGPRLNNVWVGDIAIFTRNGGGHVAIVIGVTTDGKSVICVGGNQENTVSIKQFPISRLYAVRRPPYKTQPAGARHVRLNSTGINSTSEQ